MRVISIANVKGGSGKTTVATNLAALLAGKGHATALADLDKQQGALTWLRRRPKTAPPIRAVDLDAGDKLPKKSDIVVIDGVAAMRKSLSRDLVDDSDVILIPVLPSIFDEDGTRRFLKQIADTKPIRKQRRQVGLIANRVRLRTSALTRLNAFLDALPFPTVATLRETQLYTTAATQGLGLCEIGGSRTRDYVEEWRPILSFIEQ